MLSRKDLKDFTLWVNGVIFAVPFTINKGVLAEPCFVPYKELNTSLSTIIAIAKRS